MMSIKSWVNTEYIILFSIKCKKGKIQNRQIQHELVFLFFEGDDALTDWGQLGFALCSNQIYFPRMQSQ